jgi:hypothetical protein
LLINFSHTINPTIVKYFLVIYNNYMTKNIEELLVPQHVTKWGVLTSFLILASSFVAYKYNYYLLAGLSCLLYTSDTADDHNSV